MFAYVYHRPYRTVIKIGENIIESSESNFMNLPSYVFDVDHVAGIRSELSKTVLEKKNTKLSLRKVPESRKTLKVPPQEFMEEYTDVNNKYIDDMTALKLYMWRRFTEPTIVEEEAFAQMKGIGV